MDRTAEIQYLLELRDEVGLAVYHFELMRGFAAEWQTAESAGDASAMVQAQGKLFAHIEAFLTAWARVSLLLHPAARKAGRELADPRGERLRELVGEAAEPLGDRTLRDHWMHFDERLDAVLALNPRINKQRFTTSDDSSIRDARSLRLVIVDTLDVYFYDDPFHLSEMYAALQRLGEAISTAVTRWQSGA